MIFRSLRSKKSRMGSGIRRRPVISEDKSARRLQWFILCLAFVILVGTITKNTDPNVEIISDEEINSQVRSTQTITADFTFESVDIAATKKAKESAKEGVPEVFSINTNKIRDQLVMLDNRIDLLKSYKDDVDKAVRDALLASNSSQEEKQLVKDAVESIATKLSVQNEFQNIKPDILAVWLMPGTKSLPKREFEQQITTDETELSSTAPRIVSKLIEPEVTPVEFAWADYLSRLVHNGVDIILTSGIRRPDLWKLSQRKNQEADIKILRRKDVEDIGDLGLALAEELPISKVPTVKEASEKLRMWLQKSIKEQASTGFDDPIEISTLESAAWQMASKDIVDTLEYDSWATSQAFEDVLKNVEEVMKTNTIKDILQEEGRTWTTQSREDVKEYLQILNSGRDQKSVWIFILAHMIIASLSLTCLVHSISLIETSREKAFKSLNLTLLLMCLILIASRISFYFIGQDSGYLVPVAVMAILLAILTSARIATIGSLITSMLLGIQCGHSVSVIAVASAMSITGVFSIYVVRRRSDISSAAIKSTIVGLLVMFSMSLATDSLLSEVSLHRLVLILLNGLACLFIVPGLLSPLERLFRITTDIQLLEYSDLNNEILSRMAIEVPATYAHSLMLGQIAEAAADAIGANGLLARVCAYYHDIGKMKRPEYFCENQTGENIHDALSPRLSSRAIAAHVTHGVEIAREFHLPEPIIDGIRQHHGTCMIGFFYQRALDNNRHGDVEESDFRYPGPKPQRREAAILMIGDALESGIRSLKNPTEERVREFVDKIIRNRWEDRQFDECDFTLKDLDKIAEVISHRLSAAFHTRIAYPDTLMDKKVDNVISIAGASNEGQAPSGRD